MYKKLYLSELEKRFAVCNLFFEMRNYMPVAEINKFLFKQLKENPFKNKNTFYKFMRREYGVAWKELKSQKVEDFDFPD